MDSNRYRFLFTIVVALFTILLTYRFLGPDRFYSIVGKIESEILLISGLTTVNTGTPDSPIITDPDITLNPLGRIGLGAYIFGLFDETKVSEIDKYQNLIGHRLQFVLLFRAWDDFDKEFPSALLNELDKRDIVPIVTWEPWKRDFKNPTLIDTKYSLEAISVGLHDEYIREWARASRAFGSLYILRFGHEQSTFPGEQSWYPWQGRPEAYVKAYQRIVDIFREEGALNVRYMWNPVMFWPDTTLRYYPGDTYVDYLGLTVLNHGADGNPSDRRWKRCDEQYIKQYSVIRSIDRPVIVVEFGSTERGGLKDEWISECIRMMQDNPRLVGIITLENKSDPTHPGINWSVNSSYNSLKAFKEAVSIPLFK
ncbi:MAG TPA: glycosyl hydrolase [Candidatus Dojkabacteria bacterium]|nr:glycosyl hydrolase [Candidatus Dojkabacteria bacterium]